MCKYVYKPISIIIISRTYITKVNTCNEINFTTVKKLYDTWSLYGLHQTHHNMRNKDELIQRRDHGAYVTNMPDDRNQGFEVVREDVCFIKMLFRIHPKSRQIQNIHFDNWSIWYPFFNQQLNCIQITVHNSIYSVQLFLKFLLRVGKLYSTKKINHGSI